MSETNVICILPVKNEAWIIENFIESAKAWADVIIIGDHNSSDGSTEIAQQYNCVKVIPIGNPSFDEGYRRKKIIDEARKIPGKRLIFVIDTDEMLSANWSDSLEWELMLNAEPGTSFLFDWITPLPGLEKAVVYSQMAAFVDDGTEYQFLDVNIHSPRIPKSTGKVVKLNDIKLLHYIFIDPERMFSKHRFLKCFEYLENGKRPWALCIEYQDSKIKSYDAPIIPLKEEWINGYQWLEKYRLSKEKQEFSYWFDSEILNYFDLYGTEKFRKLNIWDVDWNHKADLINKIGDYRDPRSGYEVWVHNFIEKHREDLKINQNFRYKATRLFGKTVLRALGW